jgi:CRP-like cAMP-binding protein
MICTAKTARRRRSAGAHLQQPLSLKARQDLIREGQAPDVVHLILDGFACRYKVLPEGTRSIVAYLLPGDMCDWHALAPTIRGEATLGLTGLPVMGQNCPFRLGFLASEHGLKVLWSALPHHSADYPRPSGPMALGTDRARPGGGLSPMPPFRVLRRRGGPSVQAGPHQPRAV